MKNSMRSLPHKHVRLLLIFSCWVSLSMGFSACEESSTPGAVDVVSDRYVADLGLDLLAKDAAHLPDAASFDRKTWDQPVIDGTTERSVQDIVAIDFGGDDLGSPGGDDLGSPDQGSPDLMSSDLEVPDALVPDQQAPDLPPPPSCEDNLQNGTETDIDCGGGCPVCDPGKKCGENIDCRLMNCQVGLCAYPVSCEELLQLDSSATTGVYAIQPASAANPLMVNCDMDSLGGGWTQVLQCLPDDDCQANGVSLYNTSWLSQDYGAVTSSTSYLLGKGLADLISADGSFMLQITDQQQSLSAQLYYPLNSETRQFFDPGVTTFKSNKLEVLTVDSDGSQANHELKICAALGMTFQPRSLQGDNGMQLLGQTSGDPDLEASDSCDFGPWNSQILLRPPGAALSTMMWGQVPVDRWANQSFAHRIFLRGPVNKSISIVVDGAGRRWSDGSYARSCAEYRYPGLISPKGYTGAIGDGNYYVQADTSGQTQAVYCDMTTDGGGWTLVQRSVWSWSDTQQLHTNFHDFFNVTVGSLAGAYRAAGSLWLEWFSRGDMLVVYSPRKANDGLSCGPLYYKGTGGVLSVAAATKTFTLSGLSSSVNLTNNTLLTTTDSGPSQTCVNNSQGIPWFYLSCCTTCPTYKGSYWTDEPHPMVSFTASTADLFNNRSQETCGGDAVMVSQGYYGMNAIDIFLR